MEGAWPFSVCKRRSKPAPSSGVACPFCLLTLEDAVKVKGLEDKLRVMDIMELVNLAL
jgi:Fe-S oxidoreductase